VYELVIKPALDELQWDCHHVGEQHGAGNIVKDIIQGIIGADLVIVDLTNLRGNALYELGVAHALSNHVLMLYSGDSTNLPFDLKNYRYLRYENTMAGARALHQMITNAVKQMETVETETTNPVWDFLPPEWRAALRDPSRVHGTAPGAVNMQEQIVAAMGERLEALQTELLRKQQEQLENLSEQLTPKPSTISTSLLDQYVSELRDEISQLEQARQHAEEYMWSVVRERNIMIDQIKRTADAVTGKVTSIISDHDGAELIFVPAALFVPGPSRETDEERRKAERFVKAFYLDKYPVTNRQFAQFVQATEYVTVAEQHGFSDTWRHPDGPDSTIVDDHPVVCVYRDDALAYAAWAGRRLPTRLEWERAMRGVAGLAWPWGDEWREGVSNLGGQITTPIAAYPGGVSPVGCWDMVGNVWEWLADELPGGKFLLMGGSWVEKPEAMPVGYKLRIAPGDGTDFDVGFRCAMSMPEDDI
jgi:formylglycine-generating enzyme required for sulfatase activity